MQDRIMRRAYEIFERNGGMLGHNLENWMQAERELVWRPPLELSEKDGKFELEAAIAGVEARDIEIEVTPEEIVLKAETKRAAEVTACFEEISPHLPRDDFFFVDFAFDTRSPLAIGCPSGVITLLILKACAWTRLRRANHEENEELR
jgi:hypothetical protein